MVDVSGREWTEEEYLKRIKEGVVQEKDVVRVIGVNNKRCERCLNESHEWFGTFFISRENRLLTVANA